VEVKMKTVSFVSPFSESIGDAGGSRPAITDTEEDARPFDRRRTPTEMLGGADRPAPRGKFFAAGGKRFLVKGVTYGTFAPDAQGYQFPAIDRVAADFAKMAEYGINTVRVYTVPSQELLDEAARHGLRVMVGMPWAQHIAFLDDRRMRKAIRHEVQTTVRTLADHPGVLLFALGNEIPAAVVRWHGHHRIEQFIRELYEDAKSAAPEGTFTYVNFPTTEYLELPFVDVCAFNVYLHDEPNLRRYVARLQHIAGLKPLLLAEAGADSIRHGRDVQGRLTAMQLRASFAEGACGAIAFAWTDDWWRGGYQVEDWSFGLVDAERRPKPALNAVADAFARAPFSAEEQLRWPKVSVIICAYNAAATLEDCLSSLERLTYPDFEVIVVNDGSKDATSDIARRHPSMRLIETTNGGLSRARNVGLAAAMGDIVAYTDADVRVEPDWLTYLVQPFLTSDIVACGGPNVPPPDDAWLARAVALSPGGPTHVMVDDRIAEHVPGCNLAVRRDALLAIGGFNAIYLRAGDDVDACWRLQARGGTIGFSPAALVWHHHRPSIKAYWRQQIGYGEGEAWLEPHHPDKFVGRRIGWRGRIYSPLPFVRSLTNTRINAGAWGTAAFPSVYHPGANPFTLLPHSAMWLGASISLVLAGLGIALGTELLRAGSMLGIAGAVGVLSSIVRCVRCALATDVRSLPQIPGRSPRVSRFVVRSIIAWLHLLQPIARQVGWFRGRLLAAEGVPHAPLAFGAFVRRLPSASDIASAARVLVGGSTGEQFWGQSWISSDVVLRRLVKRLRGMRAIHHVVVDHGWQLDRDVSVPIGFWAWLDLRGLVEDHGSNRCLLRFRQQLRFTPLSFAVMAVVTSALAAAIVIRGDHPWPVWPEGIAAVGLLSVRMLWQLTHTLAVVRYAAAKAAEDVKMRPLRSASQPWRFGRALIDRLWPARFVE